MSMMAIMQIWFGMFMLPPTYRQPVASTDIHDMPATDQASGD
jgi:hypothetical protein